MKKIILLSTISLSSIFYSQTGNVGINTNTPTRTLDVNGDLRLKKGIDKSTDPTYKQLLAVDNEGNVDKIKFSALLQNENVNVETKRTVYIATNPDASKVCSCGDITFYADAGGLKYKLNSNTLLTSTNSVEVKIMFGAKRYLDIAPGYTHSNLQTTFSTANFGTFQNLDTVGPAGYGAKLYTIILPKQNNMYRLTFTNNKNTATSNIYGLICEKFYIQPI